MKRRWRTPLFAVCLAPLAAAAAPGVPGAFAAPAAGLYLLMRSGGGGRQNALGRALAACALMAAALSSWLSLFALCLLAAVFVTETLLNPAPAARLSRFLAALLCLQITLAVSFVPEQTTGLALAGDATNFAVASGLLAAATLADSRIRAPGTPIADPLLVAILTPVFFAFVVTVALLAKTLPAPAAVALAASGFCLTLAAVAMLIAPFTSRQSAISSLSYAFSLEAPLEDWLRDLSAASRREADAENFTAAAMHRLLQTPGVIGVEWRIDDWRESENNPAAKNANDDNDDDNDGNGDGNNNDNDADNGNNETKNKSKTKSKTEKNPPAHTSGIVLGDGVRVDSPPLRMQVFTRRRLSPWAWFNYHILARALAEHILAKQREERHRAHNLSRAVHESGARITHDIKNILHALAALADCENDTLVRRQLPELRRRLQSALDKLRTGEDESEEEKTAAADVWWREARARFAHLPVAFSGGEEGESAPLPMALFDRALDNFVDNALAKRAAEGEQVTVTAAMSEEGGKAGLRVCDTGKAASPALTHQLFKTPVPSANGFGVSLYHLNNQAARHGYRAELANNTDGDVVFALTPQ